MVAPGMRTDPVAAGWRADAATIRATIRSRPGILVMGTIGFALRGGLVLLTVPILILPTSVEVRFLLGNSLGSTGLTGGFYVAVIALTAGTLGLAVAVLYLLARCELAMFSRFVNSTSPSAEHAWLPPGPLRQRARSALTMRLFVLEALGLLALLLAAVPFAAAVAQSTLLEIVLPSSTDAIYMRVVRDVTVPLIAWMAAVVGIEAISALTVRRVLAGAFGLAAHARIRRHPLRVVAVAAIGWTLFAAGVGVGFFALTVVWDAVRYVFLTTDLSGGLPEIVSSLVVALLFGLVFAGALVVGGLISTIRAGLWTLASLR